MSDEITFCGILEHQTPKAYLVDHHIDADKIWIPKSQVSNVRDLGKGDYEFTVPLWVADSKHIIEDCRTRITH